MKRSMSLLMALFFILMSGGSAQAADLKYAFVDVPRVIAEYEKTKDNDVKLKGEGEGKDQERQVLVDAIRAMKDEMALLSEDAKKKKQEEMNEKIRELQDWEYKARQELGEKHEEAMRGIFADIDTVVKDLGKKYKYDFIVNDQALLYQREKLNITDQILKELNANYKR